MEILLKFRICLILINYLKMPRLKSIIMMQYFPQTPTVKTPN